MEASTIINEGFSVPTNSIKIPGTTREAALFYRNSCGFSVIPVSRDNKRPLVKWKEYQKKKATADEIKEWWAKFPEANVGIVTGAISGVVVVDVDNMKHEPDLRKYIPSSLLCPVVQTPRGGLHLYFMYPDEEVRNNAGAIPGCDFRGDGGYVVCPPSISPKGKYTWLDNLSLYDIKLTVLPKEYIKHVNTVVIKKYDNNDTGIFLPGRRDEDSFHVAYLLARSGAPSNIIEETLRSLSIRFNDIDFDEEWVKSKTISAIDRARRGARNLSQEVQDYVSSTDGYFFSTDLYSHLHLSTSPDKKNVHTILKRMEVAGYIEKYGNKNGCWRRRIDEMQELDYLGAIASPMRLEFPLGEESLVNVFPGNIVCVAGTTNSGKTAWCLDFIRRNQKKHKINYFNSEAGAEELRSRLLKFEGMKITDWKFKAWQRSSNFADVVRPDEINVIDYMELTDEFWKVSKQINDIHEKISGGSGLTICCLQKNRGKEFGHGGSFSAEKARLYITMEYDKVSKTNIAEIAKGKSWVTPDNPNGKIRKFKLVSGAKFMFDTLWTDKPKPDKRSGGLF